MKRSEDCLMKTTVKNNSSTSLWKTSVKRLGTVSCQAVISVAHECRFVPRLLGIQVCCQILVTEDRNPEASLSYSLYKCHVYRRESFNTKIYYIILNAMEINLCFFSVFHADGL